MATNEDELLSRRLEVTGSSGECERLYTFLTDALQPLPVSSEFMHDIKLVCEELGVVGVVVYDKEMKRHYGEGRGTLNVKRAPPCWAGS